MVFGVAIPVSATDYGLLNPISGTVQGAGYDESAGHYGIDLYPYNYGDPVYAVASGTIMYSCERNHTSVYQEGDDCCTVKIILDEPITYNGTTYVCAFYTHMSSLVYDIYCGYKAACVEEYNAGLRTDALPTESVHVEAGDLIGYVGKGNGATHLHLSFEASEADGYAMMPNSEYYDVFGWCYNDTITANVSNTVVDNSIALYSSSSFNPIWPCESAWYVTTNYFYRYSYNNDVTRHGTRSNNSIADGYLNAIDISGGGNILATESGTVTEAGWSNSGFGNYIVIKHSNGLYSLYGHLSSISVSKGDSVNRGQIIGVMGNTGNSSGTHLHFELYGIASNGYYTVTSPFRTYFEAKYRSNIKIGTNSKAAAEEVLNRNWAYTTGGSTITPSANAKETLQWYVNLLNTYYTKQSGGYYYSDSSVTHTHSYSTIEYEAAHPHKAYTRCSCGEIGGYTGATTTVSGCSSCNDTCTCSSSYAGTYTCVTSTYPLTIRSGHGISYDAIGSIPSGATVTVTKGNGSWAHVEYNGVVGYASMEYLTVPLQQTSAYPVPFKCYPLSDADHAADAYDAVNGNHIGYIYGSDYCTVKAVYDNGWCLVNCPWDGGTKDVYTWTAFFLNMTCSPYTEVIQAEAATYIRLGSSTELGWVDAGDHVTIVDNTSARAQIIYPHTDGTYRCAWVDYHPAFTHVHTPGAAATCTTPQTCTTCDAIIAGVTSHTPGTAATCTSNQTCTVCGVILNTQTAHTPGAASTCTTVQKCTVCGIILAGTIEHSYTAGDYTDPTHPHTIYNTCSCGAMSDSGYYAKASSCTECYPAPIVSGITYSPSTVKVGDTVTFTLNATGATAYEIALGNGVEQLLYTGKTSDNTATYTFTAEGTYYISANAYNGDTLTTAPTISVVVSSATIPVSGVSLNQSTATIDIGDTLNLTATVSPSDATNKAVIWTSSVPSVSTVTNGTVTGVKAGTTTITATTADGNHMATCIVTVNDSSVETKATITFGNTVGKPGDTIEVEVYVSTSTPITTIGISSISISDGALTFIEFIEPKDYIDNYTSPFLFSSYDSEKQIITLGMNGEAIFEGSIGKIRFKIADSAQDGNIVVSGSVKILNGSNNVPSKVNNSVVTVATQLLGDINLDGYVDIDDALLLFQNSLYPEYYPVDYIGNMDFTKDGFTDIDDALLLFQYSLYPEYYPIS